MWREVCEKIVELIKKLRSLIAFRANAKRSLKSFRDHMRGLGKIKKRSMCPSLMQLLPLEGCDLLCMLIKLVLVEPGLQARVFAGFKPYLLERIEQMVQLHNSFFFITSMVVPRGTAAPVLLKWFISRDVPTDLSDFDHLAGS
ncbi:hypothetical protein Sjap_005182 [Stephania japonica]|uniref:Uncharacterized protein n=1 Tax=Stephania japonica TaxID=461633 RepID=A0AAP0K4X7_9MAGN